jgi:hypothetical protein
MKISMFDLRYLELCDECSDLCRMYILTLLKSFSFLWQAYGHKIYHHSIFTFFKQNLDIITIIIF